MKVLDGNLGNMLMLGSVAVALLPFLKGKIRLLGMCCCHGFMGHKGVLPARKGPGLIFLVAITMVLTASIPAYTQPQTSIKITATFGPGIPVGSPAYDSINSAISLYEKTFTDPITVTIDFDFASLAGNALAKSFTNIDTNAQYSDYIDGIKFGPRSADDSTALGILAPSSTPVNNPVTNNGFIAIRSANERAAGMTVSIIPIPDGSIRFNSSFKFYYRTTDTPNPAAAIKSDEYDFLAVVEHEINEVLGIGSSLSFLVPPFNPPNITEALDLFRYDSASTKLNLLRSFTSDTSARAFFSIDGDVVAGIPGIPGAPGTTPEFNNQDVTSDFNDWVTGTGVQDAVAVPGRIHNLGPNEIRALDVIGYDLVGAIPPFSRGQPESGPVTGGGVILSPTDAVVNAGGTADEVDIRDTINQNGLLFGFISGVTDFDSYLNSTPLPTHTQTARHFEWFSASNTAQVTYDLGKMYNVDKLAVWEEELRGTGMFNLFYSTDGLTWGSLAIGLIPKPRAFENGGYKADVFSFVPTNTRYIRFDMPDCLIPDTGRNFVNVCSIGEVAFEVNPSLLPIASRVLLTPPTAINDLGTRHTLTVSATSTAGTPAPGETVTVTVLAGPNAGQTAKATTNDNGKAALTYTNTGGVGTDTLRATIRNLASNIVSKTWMDCHGPRAELPADGASDVVSSPPTIVCLTPTTATNLVNSPHKVTATVIFGGKPVVGATVTFTVLAGPNAGQTATATTNNDGQATFTYTDTGGGGTDTIQADLGGLFDSNIVSKTWTAFLNTGITGTVEWDPSGAVFLRIVNTGSGPAVNVVLGSLVMRTLTGSGGVDLTTPELPYAIGSLPVGGSTIVPLTFNVPSTVRRFSLTETGTVQDAAGKSYSYSLSQVVNVKQVVKQ